MMCGMCTDPAILESFECVYVCVCVRMCVRVCVWWVCTVGNIKYKRCCDLYAEKNIGLLVFVLQGREVFPTLGTTEAQLDLFLIFPTQNCFLLSFSSTELRH